MTTLIERPQDIVGVGDIADRLGWSKEAVCNWAVRYEDFPEPHTILKMGRIWDWQLIDKWAVAHGKQAV